MIAKFFLFSVISLGMIQFTEAEPWLANRFAQNCAGCHAPGRANRMPKDRRCTLSCQGCHTSPNGGGMRNHYGKWNSQRWLRSKFSKKWKNNKATPAPYEKQVYAPLLESYKLSSPKQKKLALKMSTKAAKLSLKKNRKKILTTGYKLKTIKLEKVKVKDYDKYADARWKHNTKSKVVDLASATKFDPIRLRKKDWLRPSFEARIFTMSASGYTDETKDFTGMSVMSFDLGLEITPFSPNKKFVFETRYANNPRNSQWDTIYNNGAFTKSAYFLVDDLPYNTYVMYGLFRPMFGLYDPNHTSLAQKVNGLQYNGVVKGLSVGLAPNVPFLNVHLITPKADATLKESGMALNLGARFVTVGASAIFSYWKTKVTGLSEYDKQMWSFNLGGQFGEFTLNTDLMRYDKTVGATKNGGTVSTVDVKYRLFKENYLLFNAAASNVAKDLSDGSASESLIGYKVFLYSGVELETSFIKTTEEKLGVTENINYVQAQVHLFF